MLGIKVAREAMRTVSGLADYAANPSESPGSIGKRHNMAKAKTFSSRRQANKFARSLGKKHRFTLGNTVFYDRDV